MGYVEPIKVDGKDCPTPTDARLAYEKAQKIAKSFIDECVKKELTIYELDFVKRAISKEIELKITQVEFETKLS